MKIAKVIPVFKKGDRLCVNNYRPISLLTCLSKILEKIVYSRTMTFLQKHNIISDSQFGFREKHNTTHAILNLINNVSLSIEESCHTIGLFLDFSKAFDTINHNILLHKLAHYGIRGKALEWYRSYLGNRKQFVSVNGHESSTTTLYLLLHVGALWCIGSSSRLVIRGSVVRVRPVRLPLDKAFYPRLSLSTQVQ